MNKNIYGSRIYIFYKYNMSFHRFNINIYVDRFIYSSLLNHFVNLWTLDIFSDDQECLIFKSNLDFLSYNNISTYMFFYYFGNIIMKKLIYLKFKYIILLIYVQTFLNNIYLSMFQYILKHEGIKTYLRRRK